MSYLAEQYGEIASEVAASASACGRSGVKLLAVSKTFPVESVYELYCCGVRCFGESRVPELEAKAAALPSDIEWHFIGRLQSNKVRKVVTLAALIHAVDSLKLLERIERIAGEENRPVKFLMEVNCSGEPNKGGVLSEGLDELAAAAASCRFARCAGLMTMAREGADAAELHDCFGGLRAEFERLRPRFGSDFRELSMGMSGDFREAIACGATIVRVGSAIFGRRSS